MLESVEGEENVDFADEGDLANAKVVNGVKNNEIQLYNEEYIPEHQKITVGVSFYAPGVKLTLTQEKPTSKTKNTLKDLSLSGN